MACGNGGGGTKILSERPSNSARRGWVCCRSRPTAHRAGDRGVDRLRCRCSHVARAAFGAAPGLQLRAAGAVQLRVADRAGARRRPPRPTCRRRSRRPRSSSGSTTTRTASCAFGPEYALFGDGPGVYPVTFQFLGGFFPKTRADARGRGRRGARDRLLAGLFHRHATTVPRASCRPGTNAFAGFWIQESRLQGDWRKREPWATFLGASYFRAVGELGQVGMSARGLALNVASSTPEEFPDFVAHWISPAAGENDPVVVHSLLDGPSICGAYRFLIYRDHAAWSWTSRTTCSCARTSSGWASRR